MIRIAIDGPGGAGKSTIAKQVAKALDIDYIEQCTERWPTSLSEIILICMMKPHLQRCLMLQT